MWYAEELNIFSLLQGFSRTQRYPMIIFPDLPNVQVEGVEIAEEITLTLRTTSPTASCPSCGTASSRVQSVSSCRYVVFSAKTAPAFKRSSWNDSQISAVLMRNAQNGCKKPSVSLDSN